MQEEKFINEFWKSNERSNFSKEATVLFFYLIYIWKNEGKPEKFYVHPASLLCKVRGFTVKDVLSASKELQERELHPLYGAGKGLVFGRIQPVHGACRARERDSG